VRSRDDQIATKIKKTDMEQWKQGPVKFEEILRPIMALDYMRWKTNLCVHLHKVKLYRRFLKENLTWTTGKNKGFRADEDDTVDLQ
jgi:hypothetical protein